MHKQVINTGIIIFAFLLIFFPHGSVSADRSKILITDHFIIRSEPDIINFSAAFAQKVESYHKIITAFIEYEPVDKMNIIIVCGENDIKEMPLINGINDNLIVSVDENFHDPENIIYKKIFISYLGKTINRSLPFPSVNEELLNSIISYSISGKNPSAVIIFDLVNNMKLLPLNLELIEKQNPMNQKIIYTAFIDYIISVYGQKVLSQSIKDSFYYKNIFNAVSGITGDTIEEINKGFNKHLDSFKSIPQIKNEYKKNAGTDSEEFTSVSFYVSDYNIAVLQRKGDDSRILFKNSTRFRTIKLKHTEKGSKFNNIIYTKNNSAVVSEIVKNGSFIHVYDTVSSGIQNTFPLPYLYFTSGFIDKNHLFFSAFCGSFSDIYTIDLITGEIKNFTESGSFSCPVKIKDRIFCISVTDKYNIIEITKDKGEKRILFSTSQKISDLNSIDEYCLVFTMEMNGIKNIYSLDFQGDHLRHITNDNFDNHLPRFSNDYIYYFSYYNSKYRIFFKGYDGYKQSE